MDPTATTATIDTPAAPASAPATPAPPAPSLPRTLVLVLGAPALFGAVLGLRAGLEPLLVRTGSFPAVWLLVTALMAPALYIGASLLGLHAAAARTPRALLDGLRAGALVLLGVAPALAFLLATVTHGVAGATSALGALATATAALVGLHATFARAFGSARDAGTRGGAFFVAWALVSLSLGCALYLNHVVA